MKVLFGLENCPLFVPLAFHQVIIGITSCPRSIQYDILGYGIGDRMRRGTQKVFDTGAHPHPFGHLGWVIKVSSQGNGQGPTWNAVT